MPTFGSIDSPEINPLAAFLAAQDAQRRADGRLIANQGGQIANQGAQQTLDDRATLRGLAGALTTRDPSALATAVTLGGDGTGAVNSLAGLDSSTAAAKLAALNFQRSQISFPGLGGAPAPADASAPATAPSGQTDGQAGSFEDRLGRAEAPSPSAVNSQGFAGQFQFGTGRLADLGLYQPAQGEDLKKNQWAGQLSIPGYPEVRTLADFRNNLNAQRAAFGIHIDDIDHNIANTPGADRLSRDGLRAVAHLGGVGGMQQFVATNGAYNPEDKNNTRLSGYYDRFSGAGPQGFQAAFGHPAGRLGTPPGQQGGAPGQGASQGAQQGVRVASLDGTPGMPTTATDAAGPAVTYDSTMARLRQQQASSPVPGGSVASASGAGQGDDDGDVVSLDGPEGAQGLPAGTRYSVAGGPVQTRTTVPPRVMIAAPNQLLPLLPTAAGISSGGSTGANYKQTATPEQTNQIFGLAAGANPPDRAPNALAGVGLPAGTATLGAGGPQPTPRGGPTQSPAPISAAAPPGLPPGAVFARDGQGQFITHGMQPGMALAAVPDGRGGYTTMAARMPGANRDIDIKDVGGTRTIFDKHTGQVISREAIPDTRRISTIDDGANITQKNASGDIISVTPKSTRDIQAQAYKEDREQAHQQADVGMQAQQQQVRLLEARQLLQGLPTGAGGDARTAWSNYAETYLPPSFAAAFKSKLNLPDAVPAQEFTKLMTQNAGQQERGVMGSNSGVQAMQIFLGANPGMNLQPTANRELLNAMLVQTQAEQDRAGAYVDHVNKHGAAFLGGQAPYVPASNLAADWASQRNPQVYAGAMQAINGKPFEAWSKSLKPDEIARVGGILGRIDPSITVMGPDGKVHRVPAPQGAN